MQKLYLGDHQRSHSIRVEVLNHLLCSNSMKVSHHIDPCVVDQAVQTLFLYQLVHLFCTLLYALLAHDI